MTGVQTCALPICLSPCALNPKPPEQKSCVLAPIPTAPKDRTRGRTGADTVPQAQGEGPGAEELRREGQGRQIERAGWGPGDQLHSWGSSCPAHPSPAGCPGPRPSWVRPQLAANHSHGKKLQPDLEDLEDVRVQQAAPSPGAAPGRGHPGQVGWPSAYLGGAGWGSGDTDWRL